MPIQNNNRTPSQHFAAYEALTYAGVMVIDKIDNHCFSIKGTFDGMVMLTAPFHTSASETLRSFKLNNREVFEGQSFASMTDKINHVTCTRNIECMDHRNKIYVEVCDALKTLGNKVKHY